jgi:disulfide bond formation protein DsbB
MKYPDSATLRNQLNLEWQDFFQTRTQSWKSLEISSLLIVGLVGVGLKVNDIWVTLTIGAIVIYSAISGIFITLHHRDIQVTQNRHVLNLEKALHLHSIKLITRRSSPQRYKIIDIINPFKMSTPLFIIKMHLSIVCFTIIYVIAILLNIKTIKI